MDDATAAAAPLDAADCGHNAPGSALGAAVRAVIAAPTFREDARFFLTVYVAAFIVFMTWLA